ncbi:molybdopterin converting factor subunit 1 [Pelomonas cellulosilytica]|uniref:Molybdopterin synthase sulfur carrier subunit n=1 Tax=Pelomonas cellulosilytica TaxID=2906762 RepID=A0ABS8XVX9_9BURK|nr:molybdopterin converting factor subunit 1 [Pelomonas sp. P8]MCE4553455.1 molybdopterin converting factor subunit 1 [Pelomonas sp. P8]
MTVTVRLRFFASLREKLGEGEALSLPDGSTVADVREALRARGGVHAEALAPGRAVRSALNQTMSAESATLADGDELAFFPPVTGG